MTSGDVPGRESVLVIAAHPDDETLGCGGTMARFSRIGIHVDVVICTRVGPHLTRYQTESVTNLDALRRAEARKACKILGVRSVTFGTFEEIHDVSRPLPVLVDFLRTCLDASRPSTVLSHHRGDLHQDHRAVAEATHIALRPYASPGFVRRVLAYAIDPSSWIVRPCPTVFVPLAPADVKRKLRALRQYRSEIRDAPHPRSERSVEARARAVGTTVGRLWAEEFELVWARDVFSI